MFKLFDKKEKVKDPVCSMNISKDNAKLLTEYKGNTYFFCSNNCKTVFDANKEIFV